MFNTFNVLNESEEHIESIEVNELIKLGILPEEAAETELPQNEDKAARKEKFKNEIWDLIKSSPRVENAPLRDFLDATLPKQAVRHYIFVANPERLYVNIWSSRQRIIDALCVLCEQKHLTVFYHPAVFNETDFIREKGVVGVNSIVIDIDHIYFERFSLGTATQQDVEEWLTRHYNLPPELFPNFVTLSGNHGMHLTYLIDFLSDKNEFKTYVKKMISFFKADRTCQCFNKMFKAPTSYNVKDPANPVRSRLFCLNTSDNRDIGRLKPLLDDDVKVKEYFKTKKERQQEEKEKNKTAKKKSTKNQSANSKPKVKKSVTDEYYDYEPIDCSKLSPMTDYRPGGNAYNVICDLHNFAIRRNENLSHCRNSFIHILTNYTIFCNWTEKQTIKFCTQYYDENSDFYDEMITCIKSVYKTRVYNRKSQDKEDGPYCYSLIRVADILDFTQEDIELSHCCFSEERKKELKKTANHRQYLKRKEEQKKVPTNKQMREVYVKQNINKDPKDLAKELGIHISTVYRIRNRIFAEQQNAEHMF